jgi:hypothetical protein
MQPFLQVRVCAGVAGNGHPYRDGFSAIRECAAVL